VNDHCAKGGEMEGTAFFVSKKGRGTRSMWKHRGSKAFPCTAYLRGEKERKKTRLDIGIGKEGMKDRRPVLPSIAHSGGGGEKGGRRRVACSKVGSERESLDEGRGKDPATFC